MDTRELDERYAMEDDEIVGVYRNRLANELAGLADSVETWGAASGPDGQITARLRSLAGQVAGDAESLLVLPDVDTWIEVRLTGQPPHETDPPYDFTFRSDRDTWAHQPRLIQLARETWANVTVQRRRVANLATRWFDDAS